MDYCFSELIQKGKEFRERFSEVDFVGEIEIPESDLSNICESLWQSILNSPSNPDIQALLTTVVVNLAYYTREDCSSDSFRWLVLKKISNSPVENQSLWENNIGLPVLQTLVQYFSARDIPGRPYRYVRPIMEQAGIPYLAIPQFINFFIQLVNQVGVPFSFWDYERFRSRHQVHSHALAHFLNTEAGFYYCKEISRIYKNVLNSLLTEDEIDKLPLRIRETVKALDNQLRSVPSVKIQNVSTYPPQLALDKERCRLKLLFPFDSFQSQVSYSFEKTGSIYQSSYFLSDDELQTRDISGSISFDGNTEDWKVEIWHPERQPWAIFSLSSGTFLQAGGKITPGEYLIVLPSHVDLPQVIEDYGFFDYPSDISFRVIHAQLNTGLSISEIDFEVGVSSQIKSPQLRFSDAKNSVRYGANVFTENLPSIIVENWNENAGDDYLLLLEQNGETSRIPENLIIDGVLKYPFNSPAQVRLKIEPKSKTTREFQRSILSFTLLPKDFRFDWRNLLYEKSATPEFQVFPADKVEIDFANTSVSKNGNNLSVHPEIDIFDLYLKYGQFTYFSLTIPVYRFDLSSPLIEDSILWHDKLKYRERINLSLSPNERRQNVEIGLATKKVPFVKICDSKPVSKNFLLQMSSDEIRDAFSDCKIPVGLIAVKTRSGRVVKSNITYANENLIISRMYEASEEDFDEWLEYLPADLGSALRKKRRAHLFSDDSQKKIETDVPQIIEEWFADPKPDFSVIQKSAHIWSQACRNEHWQTAAKSDIGLTMEGRILTDAAKLYHDAFTALNENNRFKYYRCLETAYNKLKPVQVNSGIISQIACFLRLLCCLRLDETAEVEKELSYLENYWNKIKSDLSLKIPDYNAENLIQDCVLETDDVIIHNKDLDFITSK